MSNGKTIGFRSLLVAALAGVFGGCDTAALPPLAAARGLDWSLVRDGVLVQDRAAPGKNVAVPLPDWTWVGSPYGCGPDLAFGPKGEAVITSDVLPVLWRVDPGSYAVSVHPLVLDADTDRDVGFTSIVYSPEQGAYFAVSGAHGTLWRIDPQLRRAQKIALSSPLEKSCGLALAPRSAPKKAMRAAGLCVRTAQESWVVDFAPDQRSAYVRSEACTEL